MGIILTLYLQTKREFIEKKDLNFSLSFIENPILIMNTFFSRKTCSYRNLIKDGERD